MSSLDIAPLMVDSIAFKPHPYSNHVLPQRKGRVTKEIPSVQPFLLFPHPSQWRGGSTLFSLSLEAGRV